MNTKIHREQRPLYVFLGQTTSPESRCAQRKSHLTILQATAFFAFTQQHFSLNNCRQHWPSLQGSRQRIKEQLPPPNFSLKKYEIIEKILHLVKLKSTSEIMSTPLIIFSVENVNQAINKNALILCKKTRIMTEITVSVMSIKTISKTQFLLEIAQHVQILQLLPLLRTYFDPQSVA